MSDGTWHAVAALIDPVRRSLYEHVRRQHRPVSREEAAHALEISRNLAAFHLDKLVEAGMLQAHYEAPSDLPRGRGRAPKVYEATGHGVALTVPQRHYELVGTILAGAIESDPSDARTAAHHQAADLGHEIGGACSRANPSVTDRIVQALTSLGYEPRCTADGIVLDNCPFHALAGRHTALICGINTDFIAGLLAGLACESWRAELEPRPDGCCVHLAPADPDGAVPGEC